MDTRVRSEELGFCARVQDGELAFDARVYIEDLASVTKEVFAEENSNSPLTCFAYSLVSQENGAKHGNCRLSRRTNALLSTACDFRTDHFLIVKNKRSM